MSTPLTPLSWQPVPLVDWPPQLSPRDIMDVADAIRLWHGPISRDLARQMAQQLTDAGRMSPADVASLLGVAPSFPLSKARFLERDGAGYRFRWPAIDVEWVQAEARRLSLRFAPGCDYVACVMNITHRPGDRRDAPVQVSQLRLHAGHSKKVTVNDDQSDDESFEQCVVALHSPDTSLGLALAHDPPELPLIRPSHATRRAARLALVEQFPTLARAWMYEVLLFRDPDGLRVVDEIGQ